MKAPLRKLIPLARLKDAPHNPPKRTHPDALKKLVASMEVVGLLHAVTVGHDEVIIDGHRRVAAARLLGWKDIECNVIEGNDADLIYATVNVTARPMSGNDALGVWLANPHAVTEAQAAHLKEMGAGLGLELTRKVFQAGFSFATYRTAKRIARYCDAASPATVAAIVEWMLAFPVIGQVRKAMEAGVSPKLILDAVKKKKPVKLSLEVA